METLIVEQKGIEAIKVLIEYNWIDKMVDFEMQFKRHIQSQDDLLLWIQECEREGNQQRKEMMNHPFYHAMVLKHLLQPVNG